MNPTLYYAVMLITEPQKARRILLAEELENWFMDLFDEEFEDILEGTFKDKVAQIVSLLVPMFVISFKKAEDLADAMEARAYIPGEDRTKIYELKYKFSNILVYVFVLLAIASIIVLKVLGLI